MADVPLNGLSLPVGANPEMDEVVGWDELGRKMYRSPFGVQYYIETQQQGPRGSVIKGAYNALRQDPMGAVGGFATNALGGMWNAVETPLNALRGQPVTYGDAMNSAGLVSLGGVGMTAPAGALRSGAVRTARETADEVLDMLKTGRAAQVTDEMMAAADPVRLWDNYDLPMDAASRAQRAGEMGFQGPTYHGTSADIAAINPAYSTSEQALSLNEPAFWTTTLPNTAETYLPGAFVKEEFGGVPLGGGAARYYADGSNIIPTQNRLNNVDVWDMGGASYRGVASELSSALNDKMDGVVFQRMKDQGIMGLGSGSAKNTSVAALDPTSIRSQFARFDHRLSHLKNLSASIMAGGLGLSNLLEYLNNPEGRQN